MTLGAPPALSRRALLLVPVGAATAFTASWLLFDRVRRDADQSLALADEQAADLFLTHQGHGVGDRLLRADLPGRRRV